jgi:hypothetical protein
VNELARFRESFGDFVLGDVKRAFAGHAKIGAFLLAAHFIDALARLSTTQSNAKAAWDEFVPAFLPAYSSACEELYRSYRGPLAHRYSLKGFRLVDGEHYRDRHWTIEEGERVLHLESLMRPGRSSQRSSAVMCGFASVCWHVHAKILRSRSSNRR